MEVTKSSGSIGERFVGARTILSATVTPPTLNVATIPAADPDNAREMECLPGGRNSNISPASTLELVAFAATDTLLLITGILLNGCDGGGTGCRGASAGGTRALNGPNCGISSCQT